MGVDVVQPRALGGAVEFRTSVALEAEVGGVDAGIWAPDPDQGTWQPDPSNPTVWSGIVPSWIDISQRAISAMTNRGRDRWEQQFRMGSSVARFDNQDGVFNVDTPTELGDLRLRPGRWFLIEGRVPAIGPDWVPIYTGQISTIGDIYSVGAASIDSRFDVFDFMARFQIDDPPALETPIGAGQLTSDRVIRILDDADWPDHPDWRNIQTGVHTMSSSSLAQSRLAEIQAAVDAEGGAFFIDPAGRATFKARDWLTTDPRSTSPQWSAGGPADDIRIMKADTSWSDQRIRNQISFARVGGETIRVVDADSIALYGPRTFQRLDLQCQNDTQVTDLAERYLEAFRWDRQRIEEIEVVPLTPEAAFDLMNTQLGDRIRVTIQTLPGPAGWSYTGEYWINRIRHDITSDDWVTSLRIDSTDLSPPPDIGAFDEGFDDGFRV